MLFLLTAWLFLFLLSFLLQLPGCTCHCCRCAQPLFLHCSGIIWHAAWEAFAPPQAMPLHMCCTHFTWYYLHIMHNVSDCCAPNHSDCCMSLLVQHSSLSFPDHVLCTADTLPIWPLTMPLFYSNIMQCHRLYSRAYMHHLLLSHELLADSMLFVHNRHVVLQLFEAARNHIRDGDFAEWAKDFLCQSHKTTI